MDKLLDKDQLAAHVAQFPGVSPARKQQLADHLAALPPDHHAAVAKVLQNDHLDDPETNFVRGCFGTPAAPSNITQMPPATPQEHHDENASLTPAA